MRANSSGSFSFTHSYKIASLWLNTKSGNSSVKASAVRNVESASVQPSCQRQSHTGSRCALQIKCTRFISPSRFLRNTVIFDTADTQTAVLPPRCSPMRSAGTHWSETPMPSTSGSACYGAAMRCPHFSPSMQNISSGFPHKQAC